MSVLVGEVEMVVVGVTEQETESNQVQKGSGATSVNVLGLVPPKVELARV